MKSIQPFVSVIVPIYKAEAYLHRCLNSLVAQTLENIEILLLDDGSPDKSGDICDEYAQKYPQVKVFHKENEGVSATRQYGIERATGEYSIHVDPDDWVEPTMLEEAYRQAKAEDADMLILDFIIESNHKTKYFEQKPESLLHTEVLAEMFTRLHAYCWNKLIRHSCYQRFNVSFPKGFSLFEDLYVITGLLRHDIKVSYLPKAFYHYDKTINTNSIVKKYTLKSYEEDIKMFKAFQIHAQTLGHVQDLCLETLATFVVARAFRSGLFYGQAFQKNFSFLKPYVQANPRLNPLRKWKFLAACNGYYDLVFLPQRILKLLGM
jgi:glycosyltransferase involved in cell wall biosynthesis